MSYEINNERGIDTVRVYARKFARLIPCEHPIVKPLSCMLAVFAMTCMAGLSGRAAHAQGFPTKVVRIVVPSAPGGTNDLIARLLAQELNKAWSHGIIVDNRAGASGVIGTNIVAKAAPDGYTIGLVNAQFTGTASTYSKLPYDALRDFAPVTLVAFSPWILVAYPSLPVRSVTELIALAKQKPGQLNYASVGTGGSTHLVVELLKSMAGINIVHIPYKGTVQVVNDVVSGQVELTVTGLTAALPLAAIGKLRLLAVTGTNRSAVVPQVPSIGESLPGYEFNNWFGILAPRATPNDIIAQLHGGIVRALQVEEIRQVLHAQSIEPAGASSARLGDIIRQEISTYIKLVKDLGGVRVE